MIQLAVVKEQSAGGAMIWKLEPSEELCFGSEGSNKVEQLQITLPKEWDGYTVRITFLPRGRYPVGIVLPQDGIIDITADITSGAYGIGSFVLDAVQGEKVTYTVGGRYTVYTHPKAGGKAPEYTPDEYQQLVSQVKNAIPPGGTTGQVLVKKSDADRDFAWEDQSGGEQVNPDWNQNDETAPDFVKNRPFYTGDPVITELIPEQTVAFSVSGSAGQALSPVNVDLVEGQTYQVVFDGQQYNCVCKAVSGAIYIGNGAALGQPDTGEPFIYANAEGNYLRLALSGETEHVISLLSKIQKVTQIPEKYLSTATNDAPGIFVKPIYFISSDSFSESEIEKIYSDWTKFTGQLFAKTTSDLNGSISSYRIISDIYKNYNPVKYTVTFIDGTYIDIVKNEDGVYAFEDTSNNPIRAFNKVYMSKKDKTYGFLSCTDAGNYGIGGFLKYGGVLVGGNLHFEDDISLVKGVFVKWDSTTKYSKIYVSNDGALRVDRYKSGSNTMYEATKIFQDGDKEFVLCSSTANSTKKFKITVDDTGTLSATEITE